MCFILTRSALTARISYIEFVLKIQNNICFHERNHPRSFVLLIIHITELYVYLILYKK